jgi:uncharacterized protein with PIN domain
VGLLKQKIVHWGYWPRSQHWEKQLQEVMTRYGLKNYLQPFTRCMACNGKIEQVQKEPIQALLPPKTRLYFEVFHQCLSCQRIYWQGAHYDKMEKLLARLKAGG